MKKIIVNSEVLLNALQTLSKALEKHTRVPIIESYLFQVSGGLLTVSATDLQTTFKLTFESTFVDIKKGIEFCAVVPPAIVKYLQKIDRQPITLNYHEESYSIEILTDDSARAKYSGENPQDFPVIKSPETTLFETTSDLFSEFKDLLNYVSKDELRPALTGIGAITHKGAFTLCATDAHRLKTVSVPDLNITNVTTKTIELLEAELTKLSSIASKYSFKGTLTSKIAKVVSERVKEIENILSTQHFILPAKPAKILSGLTFGTKKKPERVPVVFRWLCEPSLSGGDIRRGSFVFKYESFQAELIFRDIDERYPEFWNVIPSPTQTKTVYTGNKEKFLKVIDKALLFAHKTTHQIRVCLNGVNKITAEDLDFSNEFAGEIGGSYVGEPIEIGFNGEFLSECVKSFDSEFNLELIAPNKCGVIRQGNATVIVMPVMLNQYV
jgi:DNA polymerase III sliding clamp (beta) subunit (PCNA family)